MHYVIHSNSNRCHYDLHFRDQEIKRKFKKVADLGLKLMAESRVQAFSKLRTLCCLYPRGISGGSKRLLTQGSKAEDSNNSECLVFLVGLNGVLEDCSQTDSPTERGSFKKNSNG